MSQITNAFEFISQYQWLLWGFALWGFIDACLKFSEICAREFVAWSHRMRIYWRRFWSEPDSNVL